ncbi:MAG: ATP synthase subunit I [Gammaproteobacteria bacterium]|nr:ATP synthase subunit I [Gammaproteobacteria bacterium]
MNVPVNSDVAAHARRLLNLQAAAAVVVVIGAGVIGGAAAAVAAAYGALISIASTLLLSWGVKRAQAVAATSPQRSQTMLYLGAVQRFALVLVMLVLGFWGLHAQPLPMIVGFAVAQLMFAVQGQRLRRP